MNQKLERYVDSLFEQAPRTRRAKELKEEILANLIDKYQDIVQSGREESEAYNIAISSIGDIDELIHSLKENDIMSEVKNQEDQKKSARLIAIAIMLYIISPACVIFAEVTPIGGEYGIILMFGCIAAATGLLVYNANSKPKYYKVDGTIVEEFKEWKSNNQQMYKVRNSVISAMWAIITALYFIISFAFMAWAYSWIIFIIGAAIDRVIKAYFELKE